MVISVCGAPARSPRVGTEGTPSWSMAGKWSQCQGERGGFQGEKRAQTGVIVKGSQQTYDDRDDNVCLGTLEMFRCLGTLRTL